MIFVIYFQENNYNCNNNNSMITLVTTVTTSPINVSQQMIDCVSRKENCWVFKISFLYYLFLLLLLTFVVWFVLIDNKHTNICVYSCRQTDIHISTRSIYACNTIQWATCNSQPTNTIKIIKELRIITSVSRRRRHHRQHHPTSTANTIISRHIIDNEHWVTAILVCAYMHASILYVWVSCIVQLYF